MLERKWVNRVLVTLLAGVLASALLVFLAVNPRGYHLRLLNVFNDGPYPDTYTCRDSSISCRWTLARLTAYHHARWQALGYRNYTFNYAEYGHLCSYVHQVTVVDDTPVRDDVVYTIEMFGGDMHCGGTGPVTEPWSEPVGRFAGLISFFNSAAFTTDSLVGLEFDKTTHLPLLKRYCNGGGPSCDYKDQYVAGFQGTPDGKNGIRMWSFLGMRDDEHAADCIGNLVVAASEVCRVPK